MNPTILEVIGPGFLNQVPTLDSKTLNPKPFDVSLFTQNPKWEFPKIGDPNVVS